MQEATRELTEDGWIVNQVRMWMSSQWAVRAGRDWREGAQEMYRHLLDGSPAANRLGWQWTVGTGTGKVYGFSRWQVEKRAPELCGRCPLRRACPVQDWPEAQAGPRVEPPDGLTGGPTDAGPSSPQVTGTPEAVWLTAESLGDADPASAAHPDLPRVFVLDEPLLARLRLSGKRLVFLAETLAELGAEVRLGDPRTELAGRPLATTFAPVPGWRRRVGALDVVALHPWPWLRRPGSGLAALVQRLGQAVIAVPSRARAAGARSPGARSGSATGTRCAGAPTPAGAAAPRRSTRALEQAVLDLLDARAARRDDLPERGGPRGRRRGVARPRWSRPAPPPGAWWRAAWSRSPRAGTSSTRPPPRGRSGCGGCGKAPAAERRCHPA